MGKIFSALGRRYYRYVPVEIHYSLFEEHEIAAGHAIGVDRCRPQSLLVPHGVPPCECNSCGGWADIFILYKNVVLVVHSYPSTSCGYGRQSDFSH